MAVDYTYNTSTNASATGYQFSPVVAVVDLALVVAALAGMWKVFQKAGQPGWAAIIPIYNTVVLLRVIGKSGWNVLWLFVPLVNLIFVLIWMLSLAKHFGRSSLFGVGLFFLSFIFFPILGFGGSQYQPGGSGPSAPSAPVTPAPTTPAPPKPNTPASTPPAA